MILYEWWTDFEIRYIRPMQHKHGVGYFPPRTGCSTPLPQYIELMKIRKETKEAAKRITPVKYFLLVSIPDFVETVIHFPHRTYHGITMWLYYLRRRFDRVDLKLDRSWYDTDYRMTRSIEVLFLEFIEEELGFDNFIWHVQENDEYHPKSKSDWKKLLDAYYWFKMLKPILQKRIDVMGDIQEKQWKKYDKMLKEIERKDKLHINNVWKLKGYLWT